MARIKLTIPEKKSGIIEVPVRITDLNYGNHVGNDAVVSILHEARVQWLKRLGLSEMDIGGTAIIMADLAVEYKAEIFYPQLLKVEISTGDFTVSGFDIYYEIKSSDGKLFTKAKTGIVCFDYEKRKVTGVPQSFLDKINT